MRSVILLLQVLSATSEEYSDYDDDLEDATTPQQLPSMAQRLTSRANIPPVLGSTTMDDIDDILESTMEESPTGGIAPGAASRARQEAGGMHPGRATSVVEEEEVEDDDVSFFSDPESSAGEESENEEQPKRKSQVVHTSRKIPLQNSTKQSQKVSGEYPM
jgi:hypothetical protein